MGNETSTQKKQVPVAKMVAYTVHHHNPPSSPPPAVDLNRNLELKAMISRREMELATALKEEPIPLTTREWFAKNKKPYITGCLSYGPIISQI